MSAIKLSTSDVGKGASVLAQSGHLTAAIPSSGLGRVVGEVRHLGRGGSLIERERDLESRGLVRTYGDRSLMAVLLDRKLDWPFRKLNKTATDRWRSTHWDAVVAPSEAGPILVPELRAWEWKEGTVSKDSSLSEFRVFLFLKTPRRTPFWSDDIRANIHPFFSREEAKGGL